LTWIWIGTGFLSLLCGILTGQAAGLSAAILEGARAGVTLVISLAGPICLWSGLSRVMESAGWIDGLARLLSPFLQRLYPQAWDTRETRQALCSNFTANLLGLGNAATPAGIRAARAMARGCGGHASDELCRLIVLNTASVQLLPATTAAMRAACGAAAPFDILPAVWITSACSVAAGLLAARGFSRWAH